MASQAKKIAVVTTCRADWGSTGMVVKALRALPDEFDVTVVAIAANGEALNQLTNAMLSDFPNSDGIGAPQDVIMRSLDLSRMEAPNMAIAAGTALKLAAEIFWQLKPDLVIVSGDRWEMLSIALAAYADRIPIAHLGGGDLTAGSLDDGYRFCMTELATFHFVTNESAAKLLINDKLIPDSRVVYTGSPAVDRCALFDIGSKQDISDGVGSGDGFIIILNWQSESFVDEPNGGLVAIMDSFHLCKKFNANKGREVTIVPITANADRQSDEVGEIMRKYGCEEMRSFLPHQYLGLLAWGDLLIGNSSSAFYEASFFGLPAIDVGMRQYGRSASFHTPHNVLTLLEPDPTEIAHHIARVMLSPQPRVVGSTPYGDGHACDRIVAALRTFKF